MTDSYTTLANAALEKRESLESKMRDVPLELRNEVIDLWLKIRKYDSDGVDGTLYQHTLDLAGAAAGANLLEKTEEGEADGG